MIFINDVLNRYTFNTDFHYLLSREFNISSCIEMRYLGPVLYRPIDVIKLEWNIVCSGLGEDLS